MFAKNIEECLVLIREENERKTSSIHYLKEELRKLKEEYNKDEEIQKMQKKLDAMREDYYRGFPISEAESNAIQKWMDEHDRKVHGYKTAKERIGGCSGGRFSYHFVPTGLGTSGVVRCHCGAEFEFQEIG